MTFDKFKEYAPIFVRLGIGIVFLLFGFDQTFNPANWMAWTPSFISFLSGNVFWLFTGIFNMIVGFLLLIGLLTRLAGLLASLHLIGVIITLGYNDIAIRDFGLLLGAISVLLYGADKWCVDKRIWKS